MRVSLSRDEMAAMRNGLATRWDDLLDLVCEWSEDPQKAEDLALARYEMTAIETADAKLVAALTKG